MKVLVVSYEYPPSGGGAGIVAKQICDSLGDFTELDVYHLGSKGKYLEGNYSEYSIAPKVKSLWFISLWLAIDPKKYDVIFLNDSPSAFYAGIFFSKRDLAKTFYFLHGSEPESIYENPTLKFKLVNFKYFHKRSVKQCYKILSPSVYMKCKFVERVNPVIDHSKIEVLYYGVDESAFLEGGNNDVSPGDNVLLTVSRIVEKKGFWRMLNIFEKALDVNNELVWVIIGTGDFENTLKEEVLKRGLSSSIIIKGHVPREKLKYHYQDASVFWLLSDFDESFGLVYIEANMCGLPTIGNNKAGVKEAIKNEETGFLIDDDEQLLEIIKLKKWNRLSKEKLIKFSMGFRSRSFSDKLLSEIKKL